ncbi:MAG: PadR family transcriptional regulator [Lachnospiraceae bacterium]|nr:PadR family transcriptional regulator [Lachnospiraceae bacterium]MEE1342021.1 PadR family transcriptional regulator [Lachnospiraceae bacterium]
MDATQLMKGILEGCVLAIIEKEETYGYQILSALEQGGFDSLSEGTLYPVLTRLDKNGYISCRRAKSPLGPIRKYYSITEEGRSYLQEFKETYKQITRQANHILFEHTQNNGKD